MLDIPERQMRQLKRLADDLLDASRIKQGKVPIVRTHGNMQDIVADALSSVASDIEWHGNVLAILLLTLAGLGVIVLLICLTR